MRHAGGMLDQALDAAEALGERPHRCTGDELDRFLLGLNEERDHPAEIAHLTRGDLVPGMLGEPGPEHLRDARVPGEELDHASGVLAVTVHAKGERLETAENEPRVERPWHGTERLLEEAQPLGDRRVVRRGKPAHDVRVAAEVLGRRVEDDVRSEVERGLEIGRRERVVDDEQCPRGPRCGGDGREVHDVEQRVRRGLDPHEPRVREVRRRIGRELLRRRVREAVALGLVHLREHPVRAAVNVVDADDMVARVEQVHDRRGRADARREGMAVRRVLEGREAFLEGRACRVRDTGVVVPLVDAHRLLREGRRLVDRRDHGPGRRIRLLSRMDRLRLELHAGDGTHGFSPNA